ncbi:winged helix-turn-helix domain-containing protein [Komagataeibacter europaeus]|nr:winged helix-turn-helix domain-containing protein [Komagataeibacter europaeus]
MLPVLKLSAQKVWTMRDLTVQIADQFKLTRAERIMRIPSGKITLIADRVHWAKTYLTLQLHFVS